MKISKEKIRKQFGIPDWRDFKAYEFLNTVEDIWRDDMSRWEFLRRREDYRNEWLSLSKGGVYRVGNWLRFGLQVPVNPAVTHELFPRFSNTADIYDMQPGEVYRQTAAFDLTIADNCCAIAFNMAQPIKPQIKNAEKRLLEAQRAMQISITDRKRNDKYTAYLRALDAEAAGASYEQAWNTIYPNSKARNSRQCGADLIEAAHMAQDRITKCQK